MPWFRVQTIFIRFIKIFDTKLQWLMLIILAESGAYPKLLTQPKNFFIPFKLIQQSNMVILSCLAKKNQNLNARKKSSVYSWKGRFMGVSALKTQLSVINWTFFPRIQILIFLRETSHNDNKRLLYKFKNGQTFSGCVGSCGYAPALSGKLYRGQFQLKIGEIF